jgi:RecA-family ATPase
MSGSTSIGGLFILAGFATIAATAGREWFARQFSAADGEFVGVSNAAAPAAFCEHVRTVIAASEGAPAEMRLAYLADGLSEADVLRREIARLRESQT